jgi:ribonuclease P/MRP protein subunit POP7
MGTIKRVQKLMLLSEKYFNTKVDGSRRKEREKQDTGSTRSAGDEEIEEVVLKGTGRAIERVASLAVFLQNKEEYAIRLKVGSVTVVDDIELRGDLSGNKKKKHQSNGKKGKMQDDAHHREITEKGANSHVDGDDSDSSEAAFEPVTAIPTNETTNKASESIPETRVRAVPMLEVGVKLKSILRYEQGLGKRVGAGYPIVS